MSERTYKETKINIDKFLGLKELVDRKVMKKGEACDILKITNGTYNRLSKKIDALKES